MALGFDSGVSAACYRCGSAALQLKLHIQIDTNTKIGLTVDRIEKAKEFEAENFNFGQTKKIKTAFSFWTKLKTH